MEQHEKGDNSFRLSMPDMSVDQGRASEASRAIATFGDSGMEMGAHYHGFHFGITEDE
ncbi:hypothetical protein GCM10010301_73160 [Streptomyces plicatus]|nr:hypothetical protein GCM10010301_73160 [Streptomyces plicatus]